MVINHLRISICNILSKLKKNKCFIGYDTLHSESIIFIILEGYCN